MSEQVHRERAGFDRQREPKERDCNEPNPCGERVEDRPPINVRPSGKGDEFSGFVIARLVDGRTGADFERLEEMARELGLEGLAAVLEEFGNPRSQKLIRSLEPGRLLELEATAAKSELPPLRSLTSYWRLDLRERPEAIVPLVDRLNELPAVALAYRELAVSDPVVNDADDPYASGQTYLDAAPTGIDARWAWTQPNGEGAGVAVVDLEQGWFLTHEDLTGKSPTMIYGDNRDGVGSYKGNHGTAVLGQIVADDNTLGVVGAAPSVSSVRVTSHYDAGTDTSLHVADALVAAVAVVNPGDVILLEVQRSFKPTEIDEADFDAIRLASALGIIVVEAAGNGNTDLDAYADASGDSILNRNSGDFRESGAIMVGASVSAVPHERWASSNYGSRVDCFGWGENITTAGYGDLDPGTGDDSTYTDTFGGTSGASPMVTGAVLIVQGMYQANTGTRLSPGQMRSLLSDPLTGTLQGGTVAGAIGVMPNLRTILSLTLGLVPDVYLRDNVSDIGAIPSTGGISASPDIIVRPSLEPDGNSSFGEASGTANNASLGFEVEAGQDNFIYVRMRNRGIGNAIDATATVYWSEVSTLVTPDMWNEIGTTNPINVPQGDTLVVADPITWDKADVPGQGHYCFVGLVTHAFDEAPPLPPGPPNFDWDAFRDFVRSHNNVTWRNFNVVDDLADPRAKPAPMPFLITGTPRGDIARVFDFEVMQRLPEGVEVFLEVPLALLGQIRERRWWQYEVDRKRGTARIQMPARRSIGLCGVRLPAGVRLRARFLLSRPKKTPLVGHALVIRQLYDGGEVGRITWSFERRNREGKQRR